MSAIMRSETKQKYSIVFLAEKGQLTHNPKEFNILMIKFWDPLK